MSQNLFKTLTKCLVDTAIFLEFTDEKLLNEDVGIEMLEQMGSEIRSLAVQDKNLFIKEIRELAVNYPQNVQGFVRTLPEALGLI